MNENRTKSQPIERQNQFQINSILHAMYLVWHFTLLFSLKINLTHHNQKHLVLLCITDHRLLWINHIVASGCCRHSSENPCQKIYSLSVSLNDFHFKEFFQYTLHDIFQFLIPIRHQMPVKLVFTDSINIIHLQKTKNIIILHFEQFHWMNSTHERISNAISFIISIKFYS